MIPQTMAFFWSGGAMSWMRYMTLYSFRRFHPEWKMTLYTSPVSSDSTWGTPERSDPQTSSGKDYRDHLAELGIVFVDWEPPISNLAPAHACDLCRWDHLATKGGFFSDMDILWVAPLPYETLADADALFCLSSGWMSIGFLGASPQTTLLRDVTDAACRNYSAIVYQSTGAEVLYAMGRLGGWWGSVESPGDKALATIRDRYPQMRIANATDELIYPWTWLQIGRIFLQTHEPPQGCCGIHWFGGNHISQQWNAMLDEEVMRNSHINNSFTLAARKVLAA